MAHLHLKPTSMRGNSVVRTVGVGGDGWGFG